MYGLSLMLEKIITNLVFVFFGFCFLFFHLLNYILQIKGWTVDKLFDFRLRFERTMKE